MAKQVRFEVDQAAYERIRKALLKYGDYEIGGILMGIQKERDLISICDATVADDIGEFHIASFVRDPGKSLKILGNLFRRNRFSYIGEWHSHPHYALYPSSGDIKTMRGILDDEGYGVSFALLLITRLTNGEPDMAGFLFHKDLNQFVEARLTRTNGRPQRTIDLTA